MSVQRIAIIGGGNLGLSIAEGLIKTGIYTKQNLMITDKPIDGVKKKTSLDIPVTYDNIEAVNNSDYIFLCVQPKHMAGVLKEIKPALSVEKHTIFSTATGVSIDKIHKTTGLQLNIFRVMPNTAISIQQSMTCLSTNVKDEIFKQDVQELFENLGKVIYIPEELMSSATVLAASGIAFAHRFIRAASQGGIEIGFDSETAQYIAAQTVKGAASLLLMRGYHPEREIDKVTTPQGVTISGLNEMEHQGFSSALIKGLLTSFNKINKV